ncbi:MAG: uracil-DNA glycosylase [Chromatiales bacterium]|jgi:DNA polymerase
MPGAASKREYLRLMGVQAYVRRDQTDAAVEETAIMPEPHAEAPATPQHTSAAVHVAETQPAVDRQADDHQDLAAYMEWESQESLEEQDETSPCPGRLDDIACLDWPALQQKVADCQACDLHKSRKNTVFGVGNPGADVMIIGEAPGADEDAKGEPFVGRAGKLLDAMLQAIGLNRQKVFIANILKCRPPANRNPSAEEVLACEPFLLRQIELIQPKLILSVGGVSAHNLLKTDERVGQLRQRWHKLPWKDIPVQVTYHPAYLLRQPSHKAKAWEDLLKLKKAMQEANIT